MFPMQEDSEDEEEVEVKEDKKCADQPALIAVQAAAQAAPAARAWPSTPFGW